MRHSQIDLIRYNNIFYNLRSRNKDGVVNDIKFERLIYVFNFHLSIFFESQI